MPPKSSRSFTENTLIRQLQQRYRSRTPRLRKGIGDDAAVVEPVKGGEYWLVTTDMLLENIDFRRQWITPHLLGRKSISVNLSDLAAMGARPRFYTVSLAIPDATTQAWIHRFYDGLADASQGAVLIGGDLSRSEDGIAVSITAFGESLNRKVVYRSGGRAGDALYVTGVLGKSAAGLALLRNGNRTSGARSRREAVSAHLNPEVRCETGLWLAQTGLANCMIDLSDGLSMDLPRICTASGVGAVIRAADLPVFAQAASWGNDPVDLALHGGEDYELLFSVPESKTELFELSYPAKFPAVTRIGELTPETGRIWLIGQDMKRRRLPEAGFDHFKQV